MCTKIKMQYGTEFHLKRIQIKCTLEEFRGKVPSDEGILRGNIWKMCGIFIPRYWNVDGRSVQCTGEVWTLTRRQGNIVCMWGESKWLWFGFRSIVIGCKVDGGLWMSEVKPSVVMVGWMGEPWLLKMEGKNMRI